MIERNIVPCFIHEKYICPIFYISTIPAFIQGLEEERTILVWPRTLEGHKNPKKMRRFSLFSTSPTLFRGWEWTILVAALQRLLKKPAADTYYVIMYVFMCADQSRWIGRITKVCTLYATHFFGSVTFSS